MNVSKLNRECNILTNSFNFQIIRYEIKLGQKSQQREYNESGLELATKSNKDKVSSK